MALVFALVVLTMMAPKRLSFVDFALYGAAMWAFGAAIAWMKRKKAGGGGTREFEELTRTDQPSPWQHWINFARSVADYEIRMVLVACYVLLIAPIAIAFRVFEKPLLAGGSPTSWIPRNDAASLDAARRPF